MRQALRSLRRRPAFALAAILTVALGIGANTAVFSVIYGVLLQPLPFRDPARLVQIWETHPAFRQLQPTVPDFRDWQSQSHSFDGIAAHTLAAMDHITLRGEGEPEVLHGTNATADLFPTMGIEPILGRGFTAAEDREKARVTVIGEKLWRRKFGADPNIVGRRIRMEPELFTVVGVVSERQCFPEWADVWIPFSLLEEQLQTRRKYHPLEVIARLKKGVSAEEAQKEMQGIARRLAATYPDTNGNESAVVVPLVTEITGDARPSLLLVWAAVGLVLLIACANLAHLLLARMLERREELAIRSALGAGWLHLIKPILTESLILAGLGGVIGLAAAFWVGQALRRLAQGQIPRMEFTGFQAPVWLFAAVVSLVCGVLFCLPACWRAVGDQRVACRSVIRARFGSALMVGEVALAFVVIAGAVLVLRGFVTLLDEKPGFDARGVVAVDISMPFGLNKDANKAAPMFRDRVLPALRALPGVERVATANAAPMSLRPTEHSRWATRFGIEGRTFDAGHFPVTQMRFVTPEYFLVLGIPLKRGGWLTEADLNQPRCLVNQTLAARFLPGQEAVGQHLLLGVMDAKQTAMEIAGVVGDVREFGLDEEAEPEFYVMDGGSGTVLLKTAGDPAQLDGEVRRVVHAIDADIVVRHARRLQESVEESMARRRFALVLMVAFAGLAAMLTGAGIYGLLAYSVNARLREFGVRAAVGASRSDLTVMILREAARSAVPGLVVGFLLSMAAARLMRSLVYRISPFDPWSVGCAAMFLLMVALVSAYIPARKAASVNASSALRAD